MGGGQPDVERHQAGLEAEAAQCEQEGGRAPACVDMAGARGDRGEVERAGLGGQDREREHDHQEADLAQRDEQERALSDPRAGVVAQDKQVAEQRHRLPRDQERDHVAGDQHRQRGQQREVVDQEVDGGARGGLVVAGAVESDRGGDHAEDQDERGRERRQVEAGAADRVGAEGERGAGAVHGEEHAADSRRHATEAREQGGADKPDPPRPAQAEDRGRQPRPGGSDRERADRVSHPALSRVEVERQCRDSVLEPPDRDQQPLEQGQRAWRAAGDVHVDGQDAIDRAMHELVLGVDAAERAGSDRDHDLRVGGGVVGLQEQVVRGADRGPGHHQQVGVPRRRREEEPQSMEVVVGGGEQPYLGLAHRARAGVHRADVQAAAERPRHPPAQLARQLVEPGAPLEVNRRQRVPRSGRGSARV